jgi:hypothetical protein
MVRLVVQGVARDLAQAMQMLAEHRASQTPIDLPDTPTKFPGRLVPPVN